jgi:hypothetical protein
VKKPSDDVIERVLALLRGGATLDAAATNSGLDPAEFSVWLARPRNRAVAGRVAAAFSQADLQDLAVIKDEKSWQAAKARMELRKISEQERQLHRLRALTVD